MPIKALLGVQREVLERSDPTKKTWVEIKHHNFRDNIQRDELLKNRTFIERADGFATQSDVNTQTLMAEEIWLTYHDCNIVIEGVDKEGKPTEDKPFGPRDSMTRVQFYEELGKLDPSVVREWHEKVRLHNKEWSGPF